MQCSRLQNIGRKCSEKGADTGSTTPLPKCPWPAGGKERARLPSLKGMLQLGLLKKEFILRK